jgi:hypothetical protein
VIGSRGQGLSGAWPALVLASTLAGAAGCGGGSPLLHGANVLAPGDTTFGAGASAQVAAIDGAPSEARASRVLEDLGFGAGVAPWAGARIGIEGGNEAGLAYTGRSIRLDFRHAFQLGDRWALSLGAGGSAIIPRFQGEGLGDQASAYGPGVDVPVLFGRELGPGLYSFWFGPRAGYDHLSGSFSSLLLQPSLPEESLDLEGNHFWAGGLVGVKVGFRRVHVALEVNGAWHHGQGELGDENASFDQVSVTPAGALIVAF